jgi:hypothetical protein
MLAIPLLLTGAVTGIGPAAASAATCQASSGAQVWGGQPPPSPGTADNDFTGVTVLSPCDAWAAGDYQDNDGLYQTLVEHWDGTAWTVVPSPNVAGRNNQLNAVRAKSATDVWAVGESFVTGSDRTLILHWDGNAWAQVASPSPGTIGTVLEAVAGTSSTDAWAVGASFTAGAEQTLTLHWNGRKWPQVASPNPGTSDELFAVRGTSSTDTWAVGVSVVGGDDQTLALHWNGSTWTRVSTPDPGGSGVSNELLGVAA